MTWWCSATGQPWTWAWKAYPGVWLFVALLAILHVRVIRRTALYYVAGLLTVWLALDWPIGPLGTGYLISFHTVSYILLSLIAPPLLLAGIPSEGMLRAAQSPRAGPLLRNLARPLIAKR